jgi:hypothetical protein
MSSTTQRKSAPAAARTGSTAAKGYRKVLVSLREDQAQELKRAALRRALEAGGQERPDAGVIVREALDAWFAKNAKR